MLCVGVNPLQSRVFSSVPRQSVTHVLRSPPKCLLNRDSKLKWGQKQRVTQELKAASDRGLWDKNRTVPKHASTVLMESERSLQDSNISFTHHQLSVCFSVDFFFYFPGPQRWLHNGLLKNPCSVFSNYLLVWWKKPLWSINHNVSSVSGNFTKLQRGTKGDKKK